MDSTSQTESILGVEGGATKTEWIYFQHDLSKDTWTKLGEGQLPKANFKLVSIDDLRNLLDELPKEANKVGLYLAGVICDEDQMKLRKVANEVWPSAQQITCGNDRESGFAASLSSSGIIVISGTGSSVTGRREDGQIANAGGKGHILGDNGSAYDVAIDALKLIMNRYDSGMVGCQLTTAILSELLLNEVLQLIDWTHKSEKSTIARLAKSVFDVYNATGDVDLLQIFKKCAKSLAKSVQIVSKRLEMAYPTIALRGSMFTKQPLYVQLFEEVVASLLPMSTVMVSDVCGATGAARLVANCCIPSLILSMKGEMAKDEDRGLVEMANAMTEQRNDRSLHLDTMAPLELVDLFVEEEMYVYRAVKGCRVQLSEAIEVVSRALERGGHLFYVGAGTSGRLGVLDASEIPPTFGEPPTTVQGIIAGGFEALHRSVEGAEDSQLMGCTAIRDRGVTCEDVVCGISACGRTPFVLGALDEAKRRHSPTVFVTSNPNRPRKDVADVEIVLETGAELVTGSTRLKAGTATKVALNIITTCSMIRLGKVKSNLMVSLRASNVKLKDRATRLVAMVKRCSYQQALDMLKMCQWDVNSILQHSNLELDQVMEKSIIEKVTSDGQQLG